MSINSTRGKTLSCLQALILGVSTKFHDYIAQLILTSTTSSIKLICMSTPKSVKRVDCFVSHSTLDDVDSITKRDFVLF